MASAPLQLGSRIGLAPTKATAGVDLVASVAPPRSSTNIYLGGFLYPSATHLESSHYFEPTFGILGPYPTTFPKLSTPGDNVTSVLHDMPEGKYTCNFSTRTVGGLATLIVLITALHAIRMISMHKQNAWKALDNILAHFAYASCLGVLIAGLVLATTYSQRSYTETPFYSHGAPTRERGIEHGRKVTLNGMYYFAIITVRFTVLLFYFRSFTPARLPFATRMKGRSGMLIIFNGIFLALWSITMIGIWGAEVKQHMHQEHELITPIEKISGRLVGSINAFSDFCLLSLPLCCLYKLEIKKKDKVALYVTFLLGLIATAASITRASLFDKNPRTIPWMNRELCGFDYWYHIDMITMSLETSTGLLAANLGSLYYVFIISGIPRAWYEAVMGKVQTRRGRALLQASDSSTQPSTRVYTDASFESIQVVDLKMSS